MAGPEFEDFLFDACLRDWEAEHARLSGATRRCSTRAQEARIVGAGRDLQACRWPAARMEVDAGTGNMPGGEFFGCPVETSAEGTIAFTEFPGIWNGRDVRGIRLRFSGRPRRRRLGRDGGGIPARDARHRRGRAPDRRARHRLQPRDHALHAEHLLRREDRRHASTSRSAQGFADLGGTNESAIHWDIVKDLRRGGRIEVDGRVVQENGAWVT